MKNLSFIIMLLLIFTACTNTAPETSQEAPSTTTDTLVESDSPDLLMLTLEELALYNGKNGQPAYVAVDGIIYDMTNSSLWAQGNHNGFEAGKDLTEPLNKQSPHGSSKLKNVPVVGELVAASPAALDQESSETVAEESTETAEVEPLMLTLSELANYNGKDGQPAYVAVDGIIYDMTNSSLWLEGNHNGFEAGKDLSDPLNNQSPHGSKKLENVPIVGQLVEESTEAIEESTEAEASTQSQTTDTSESSTTPETPAASENTETDQAATSNPTQTDAQEEMTSTTEETSTETLPADDQPSDTNNNGLIEYTLEELSAFTGKDGALAYIAYKGLVYDVTSLGPWSGGQHNGNYAGLDLTDDLAYASHGEEKLDQATLVGEIVQ